MVTKAKSDVLDLATLDAATPANKGAEIELLHPVSAEPLGVFITILGKYSEVFVKHIKKNANAAIRRAQQLKMRGKPEEIQTIEKLEEKSVEMLAACTIAWRTGDKPILMFEGEALECTPENAAKIYESDKLPWIRQQVDEAIADLGNFM